MDEKKEYKIQQKKNGNSHPPHSYLDAIIEIENFYQQNKNVEKFKRILQ